MQSDNNTDSTTYKVVVNHEEQYSIWPAERKNALGWDDVGKIGSKSECLAFIKEIWTDMRPLSLREKMAETEANRPELEAEHARLREEETSRPSDAKDDLVAFLSEGDHPLEASVGGEKSARSFREAIDRGLVHVKFTDTRGGTDLGVRVDPDASDLTLADFTKDEGTVRVVGDLTLNSVRVRCVAEIDLSLLSGHGRLVRIEE